MKPCARTVKVCIFFPEKVISERIADLTVHADPRAIQWIPRHLRTADICLYAETNYPDLKIYVPESISQSENIYSFHRRVDDLLRQPLKYEEYKTIYNGGAVVVEGVKNQFRVPRQMSSQLQSAKGSVCLISYFSETGSVTQRTHQATTTTETQTLTFKTWIL